MNEPGEKIKSVQIIRIEGSKFVFDYELFDSIVKQNKSCCDLPVAVIIINGALRTGKSFFSNFIIKHMHNLDIGSGPGLVHKRDDNDQTLTDYFISRRGADVQTLGIWILNKIFIHDGKAIVLMDTQGIFDQELNQAMTIALISLSTIISSYQIYNLDKRIQEDHLCNMAYFSAYSSLVSNTDKIGQTLCLLIRDWQNYENNFDLEKCDIEAECYKNDFLQDTGLTDKIKIDTRKKIYDTYDDIVVRLCPHPGHLVTEGQFSGKLSEIRDDFKIHVEHIITEMLKSVKPKRISGTQNLLCRELPNYMQQYVMLYENIKDSLPEAMTILETTEKICQENARTKTLHYYKEKMLSRLKSRSMSSDDIEAWHKGCLREAQKFFKKMYIMGKDDDIEYVKTLILNDIESEHAQFLLMAHEKNMLVTVFNTLSQTAKYIYTNYGPYINDYILIQNAFILLGIFYIISMFMPFGGDFIGMAVRHFACVLCGALICLNAGKHNPLIEETNSEAPVPSSLPLPTNTTSFPQTSSSSHVQKL